MGAFDYILEYIWYAGEKKIVANVPVEDSLMILALCSLQ